MPVIDAIHALLNVLLVTSGAAAVTGTASAILTTMTVATVLSALVVLALSTAGSRSDAHHWLAQPRRSIDVSALLPQSDPDAAGHPRPRAPGVAAPAA